MMAGIVGWLLGGGIGSILSTAGSITKNVTDVKIANVKASTDTHKIDVEAATTISLKQADANVRLNELSSTLAEIDARNQRGAWMRQVGFGISAWVLACAAFQYTLPKAAAWVGIDVSKMPEMWAAVFIAVFLVIFGIRQLDKNKNANTVTKVQSTIRQ
jgi:hypothetical protein